MKAIATEENVRRAYIKLKEDGIEPTVENIRKITNGGSNSTICKILRMIDAENVDTVHLSPDPDKDILIKELAVQLVENLYNHCKKRADDIARDQYRSFSSTNEESDKKIKQLEKKEEYAAETNGETAIINADALALQIQRIEQELKQKDEEITTIKKQMEVEISALNQQIKELRQAHEQQKHTNQMLEKMLTANTSDIK